MKKIKKLVLHEASHVLSSDAMLSLFGGAPHLLIYSCVCSKEGFPNKNGTVKVFPKDNPETSILLPGRECYGYSSASCAFSASV